MNLPQAFIDRMAVQLGDELPAFLRTYEEPYHRGVRLNGHKLPLETAQALLGEDLLEAVPWEPTGHYLTQESRAGATVLHEAGAWYLQEPSAMIPAAVLNPKPGEHVLDLCAAPGGKTTQLALRMAGQGTLICNEPIHDRAKILSRNVERMGVPNALVVSAYPDALADAWEEAFDAIQCDAPCSGEGMFRRHPETRAEWNPESPAGCAKRQAEILDQAARMLRPGGRLVYSTCTLNRIENEDVVEGFLARHPDFALQPFALPALDAPRGMLSIYPHRIKGEGHFVALLVRKGDAAGQAWRQPAMAAEARRYLQAVQGELPAWVRPNYAVVRRGEECDLFCLPELSERWEKLPRVQVLRCGLHLGTVKAAGRAEGKGRATEKNKGKGKAVFTPEHAFALALTAPDVPRVDLTEEQARSYQAGQTLPAEGKGWALACWQGVPLGWGKISDGVMKNHYPKGLRR